MGAVPVVALKPNVWAGPVAGAPPAAWAPPTVWAPPGVWATPAGGASAGPESAVAGPPVPDSASEESVDGLAAEEDGEAARGAASGAAGEPDAAVDPDARSAAADCAVASAPAGEQAGVVVWVTVAVAATPEAVDPEASG